MSSKYPLSSEFYQKSPMQVSLTDALTLLFPLTYSRRIFSMYMYMYAFMVVPFSLQVMCQSVKVDN